MTAPRGSVHMGELGTSRSERLARISEAGLVNEGRVFLLSLEPIRLELGSRWPAREEVVWETLERAFAKRMPPPDVFVRINATTVLAAIASTDAYEGQVRCAEILKSVLTYFLGRSGDEDIGISRVSNLSDQTVTAEPVDLVAPFKPILVAASPLSVARSPEHWTPPLAGRRSSASFDSDRHGELTVTSEILPVWRLHQSTISAYAILQRTSVRLDALTDADRERISEQAVDQLIPILEEYQREGGVFALILPCPFSVLSVRRSRQALLKRCHAVEDIMRRVVLLEIEGIEAGAPASLVKETASMVRPFVRALTLNLGNAIENGAVFPDAGLHGLAINGRGLSNRAAENLIRAARRRTLNVVVHDAPSSFPAEWLKECGASHVTWASDADTAASPASTGGEDDQTIRTGATPGDLPQRLARSGRH